MPYVTGGYASAHLTQYARFASGTGALFEVTTARHDGWYIGGGLEWNVSSGWYAGVEYRHYEFDKAFHLGTNGLGGLLPLENRSIDASSDSVTARVSWKFGRPEAAPLK